MVLFDTQLTASEVLRTFHRDEPYLFLGSAFTTIGIVSGAFCLLRRRVDALLICMGIFAVAYGERLWLDSGLLRITLPNNAFFDELRWAVDFFVPIPGFIFFQVAGFLGRGGRALCAVLSSFFVALIVATFAFGTLPVLFTINNGLVIGALVALVARSIQQGSANRDFVVVRGGLVCFVALALWDNIVGNRLGPYKVEPFGFAVFLGCLGYVAARRVEERDQALGVIRKELELARTIQLSVLPGAFPQSPRFRVAARYVPMTSVAGDFYDFLVADENHAGLLIADVSGHGVPAALIASMVKMAAASQRPNAAHPAQLLAGMNAALCGNTQGQFVTAAYVHLDAEKRELRYAAAGHPSMLLLRGGNVTEIVENGLLLAASEQASYLDKTLPIEPGDRLLLYTDGMIEARNSEGKLFGEEALFAALRKTGKLPPAEASDGIIAEVRNWAKSQDDDLTVLVCDFLAAG